ncbi:hypothetical protein M2271_002641 [Streptomyces sp. LBL]|nr:hypothetical protein [Streptomyces sp. LBL]
MSVTSLLGQTTWVACDQVLPNLALVPHADSSETQVPGRVSVGYRAGYVEP